MSEAFKKLYQTVLERKDSGDESSYTRYLFEKGIDKILKKCGEECAEMIIAAKNRPAGRSSSMRAADSISTCSAAPSAGVDISE